MATPGGRARPTLGEVGAAAKEAAGGESASVLGAAANAVTSMPYHLRNLARDAATGPTASQWRCSGQHVFSEGVEKAAKCQVKEHSLLEKVEASLEGMKDQAAYAATQVKDKVAGTVGALHPSNFPEDVESAKRKMEYMATGNAVRESDFAKGTREAVACLLGERVHGMIRFMESTSGVRVTGTVHGLSPGDHGFHIHQYGDTTNGCTSCGEHFNPTNKTHGAREALERHAGDLGNITADAAGVAHVDFLDSRIPLQGPHSILGRALVVHYGADDLGMRDNMESKLTGNAGGRVCCGIVAMASVKPDDANASA